MREDPSHTLSTPQLPGALSQGVESHESSSLHISTSMGVVQIHIFFRQPFYFISLGGAFQETRSHSGLPGPQALAVFPPPLPQCPLSSGCRSCVVVLSTRARQCMMWFSLAVSDRCKEKPLWWGSGATLLYRYKDKYLECSQERCCFSKVVVGSPLRSMVSLGLGCWFSVWGLISVLLRRR